MARPANLVNRKVLITNNILFGGQHNGRIDKIVSNSTQNVHFSLFQIVVHLALNVLDVFKCTSQLMPFYKRIYRHPEEGVPSWQGTIDWSIRITGVILILSADRVYNMGIVCKARPHSNWDGTQINSKSKWKENKRRILKKVFIKWLNKNKALIEKSSRLWWWKWWWWWL